MAWGRWPWPPSPKHTPLLRQDNCIHRLLIKFGPSLMQLFLVSLYEKWLRFRDYGITSEQGKGSDEGRGEEKIEAGQTGEGRGGGVWGGILAYFQLKL